MLARDNLSLTATLRSGGLVQYITSTGWELWIAQNGDSAPMLEFARTENGRVYELAGAGDGQSLRVEPLDPLAMLARAEPATYQSLLSLLQRAMNAVASKEVTPRASDGTSPTPQRNRKHELRFPELLHLNKSAGGIAIMLMQPGRSNS
jgi:hypothetical protein